MRIVSLAPSATTTLEGLGYAESIVATAGDDAGRYPSLGGWLTFDPEDVATYDPDIVVTTDALQEPALDTLREYEGIRVVHLDPRTLDETLDSFVRLGNAVGDMRRGVAMRHAVERQLQALAHAPSNRPTIYCEEWDSPPMAAGNWVPELVRLVGGQYPFVDAGERSAEVTRTAVEEAAPEAVVLHTCGERSVSRTAFEERGWEIPATSAECVLSIQDDWLNQPSPHLVRGARVLRKVVIDCAQKA